MNRITAIQALWRHRGLFLAFVIAFLLAGVAASVAIPTTYQASATLYLDTSRDIPAFDLQSSQLLQHDFIVLASERPVLSQACGTAGVECSAQELANPDTQLTKRLSVASVTGTSLLSITASASTADQAAVLANAVATALVEQDSNEINRLFKPAEDSLAAQLSQLQTAITKEQQALQAGGPAVAAHTATLNSLIAQYTTLQGRQQDLLIQKDHLLGIPTVVDAATPPAKPFAPDPLRYILAALGLGLAFGALAALLRQRFDHRLFDPESLAIATGTPIVIVIRPRLYWHAPCEQSYALAHANLLARYPNTQCVLVAGASVGDRTDLVAGGLADAAAEAGQRVFLLQSDAVAVSTVTASANGERNGVTAATVPFEHNARAASFALAEASGHYDLALVATPSPESSPATLSLAKGVDQAIIVASAGKTKFEEARRASELLRQAGANIAASVFITGPTLTNKR